MRPVSVLVLASAVLGAIPGTASSQAFVTPFIGYNFGGDSGNCLSLRNCDDKRANFGISVGKTNGVFGLEQEIAYVPHFFGSAPDAATRCSP